MKRMLFTLILVILANSLGAADIPETMCTADDTAGISMAAASGFPVIASNQKRPARVGTQDIYYPDPVDPGGSGWTAGACNCKRRCPASRAENCKLDSDWAQKCISRGVGTCDQCEKDCGG